MRIMGRMRRRMRFEDGELMIKMRMKRRKMRIRMRTRIEMGMKGRWK